MDNGTWRIRAYREDDLPAISALINASDEAVGMPPRANAEDLRQQFNAPGLDPFSQVLVAEEPGSNTLLGYGRAFPSGGVRDERVYNLSMRVHPSASDSGLAREITERLVAIARHHETLPDTKRVGRVRLRSYTYEKQAPVTQAWEQIGMKQVRQAWTMLRDLDMPIGEATPPAGVKLRTYKHPEDNRGSLLALNRAFADYFDSPPLSQERWDQEMAGPYTRPDLSWLAEAEENPDEIVGFCICWIDESENALRGALEGWIEGIGTVPEWRNKGVGRSLLLNALRSLKSAGMNAALLDVDAQGPSAATHLFESVDFTTRDRMFQYQCLLDDVTV
jgi:mycothiol synthase